MNGTMQVIAALYTTLNVAGPNGAHLDGASVTRILALLLLAAVFAGIGIFGETRRRRRTVKGPSLPALRRHLQGPKPRRA